jgi:hypothetical protein
MVTILRDPEGGPNRILLEFSFEFTKNFLGIKDMYVSIYSSIFKDFNWKLAHL